MTDQHQPTSLQRLINEPKGKLTYKKGECFLLHVFWEAPNIESAKKLLKGLSQCSVATERDTPCVPTYFFRISKVDEDVYGPAPKLVSEHAQLSAAIKKLNVGISKTAVVNDMTMRGIPSEYLALDLSDELPPSLHGQKPVAIEFTELYMDERSFMEHTGSKDYLQGYGIVMSPGLMNRPTVTLRFGNPSTNLIDKILEPILKECVTPLPLDYHLWNQPKSESDLPFMMSLDIVAPSDAPILSHYFHESAVWCIYFAHPLRPNTSRIMASFSKLPNESIFKEIACLEPLRGEIYAPNVKVSDVLQLKSLLNTVGLLDLLYVNASDSVGYVLHPKSYELDVDDVALDVY